MNYKSNHILNLSRTNLNFLHKTKTLNLCQIKSCMIKIEIALPKKVVTNDDLGLNENDKLKRLGKKLGINERRVCADDETALSLAVDACKKLFKSVDASKIDFVIYCTQSPEYFLPTTACLLQEELGLSKSTGAFDYNLGCSGYIYGLAMAKSFIQTGIASNVLLVTAEAYSKHIHKDDLTNQAIFGDAATATLVDQEVACSIGRFNLGSDGGGKENLIVKTGGAQTNFVSGITKEDKFFMNGPEVFKFTLDNVPVSINDCLDKNELTLDRVDYMILHQANAYMLKNLRKKIGIEESKFYSNVLKVGNSVSSTIPIALKDALEKGLIKKNDCVLLSGFGVGYSWGSTIIKF